MTRARRRYNLLVAMVMAAGVALLMSTPATGVSGETWILLVHHRDGGGWTEYPGAGYNGTSAWNGDGWDGVRRAYWELNGYGSLGNEPPEEVELYRIEFFAPSADCGTDWQPIESQLRAVDGETFPIEPIIPWVGAYGTNHQWIGTDGFSDGQWHSAGPGPHTPESARYDAGPHGLYMWLKKGAWMYAKWDFGWATNRCWSALRLTQMTPWGACCIPPTQCVQVPSQFACQAMQGRYHGDGSNCDVIECCPWPSGDTDADGDMDQEDFSMLQRCFDPTEVPPGCHCFNYDEDGDVDSDDVAAFEACAGGPEVTVAPDCGFAGG